MSGPLAGIKIVELAQMIAVPGATHLLASQGAEIIKVENTTGGDDLRMYGSRKNNMSGWFVNANAGKRSIGLDLSHEKAKAILWAFVKEADVFIEGFRPGAVARLGFSAEAALEINPSLVYVSSSGFGSKGPYSGRPVYDPVIQALSGWAGAQKTESGPNLIRGMVADKVAALTTSQAITAALLARSTTGKGQYVEVSMLEANIAFNWPDVMMHETLLDEDALHLPNLLSSYQLFSTSDGWVSVTAGTDSQWEAVCKALERMDLATDERFSSASNRSKNFTAWYGAFDEMLGAFTTKEALDKCQIADVPAVSVLDPSDVANDPHVVDIGSIREKEHPVVGRLRVPRQGATFNGDPEHESTPAPTYCEHTDELLSEIGYTSEEIIGLRDSGTIS
ncbi:MAG: CoA transferase [Acidimicrobiales bacterium]|jgi:crotonobetainyl-CoA:carnitine CoA-transferase CaiB-like acyl-CoA transferase|nr:CoA transferase [Acidimicrobiales bacterium]MDP6298133.1 CoA transferase [Acidimicrobiales bacterium]HJM29345.1 CoA transferase [Acidimicrobiales bacterium]HJM96678.1 CoA transferase [Acidimicrobiales bacterium]